MPQQYISMGIVIAFTVFSLTSMVARIYLEDIVTNHTCLDIKSWQGRATGPSEYGMHTHMSASRFWAFPRRTMAFLSPRFQPIFPARASGLSKKFSRRQHHLSRRLHFPRSIIMDRFYVCSIVTRYWSPDLPIALASFGISRPGIVRSVGFVNMSLVSLTSALTRSISFLARRTPRYVYGTKRAAIFYGS